MDKFLLIPKKTNQTFKLEKQSCGYFFEQLREKFSGAVIEKIPDVGDFTKQYDGRMLYEGRYIAFECKHTKKAITPKFNPFKLLEPHQAINLLKVIKNGGQSYVVLYSEINKDFYIYEFYGY